ncbi:hypothetical protein B0H14DRAFT_400964 [Mycena olivaceomarginata]|nr:hypothetical protein B0H14DRAFT_400964 [Mycena olivaceomarginata]
MSEHYRTGLNNVAQQRGWTISYEATWTGPQNNPLWTAKVYLNNIEWGCGTGGKKRVCQRNSGQESAGGSRGSAGLDLTTPRIAYVQTNYPALHLPPDNSSLPRIEFVTLLPRSTTFL